MASRKIRALAVVSALAALGLAACTSSAVEPGPTDKPSPDASSPPSSTPTEPEPTAEDQAIAAWESFHTERLRQLASQDDPDPARFDDLATEPVTEAVIDLIFTGRGDVPFVITDTEFWPEAEVAAGQDRATVSDCIIIAERAANRPDADPTVRSQVWTGTAISTDAGWRIDEITPGAGDCVPPELNRQLLDAYASWHEAKNAWWDPPDPDHPLLAQTMIEPGLSDARKLLTEHREMGIVVRDSHDIANAVVFELGVGSARVSDCFPATDGDVAAYDADTGERREDLSPTPREGQMDRVVLDLVRGPEGVWKASGWRSSSDSDCTPGGTPYVVAP